MRRWIGLSALLLLTVASVSQAGWAVGVGIGPGYGYYGGYAPAYYGGYAPAYYNYGYAPAYYGGYGSAYPVYYPGYRRVVRPARTYGPRFYGGYGYW